VVEKRSNLVRLMPTLFDKVIKWGEKLITRGEGRQPPARCHPCPDAYLAESNSKLLVVLPLKDDAKEKAEAAEIGSDDGVLRSFRHAGQLIARLESSAGTPPALSTMPSE